VWCGGSRSPRRYREKLCGVRKMAAILVSAPLHRETKAIKETVDGTRPGPALGPQWASW